MQYGCTLCAFLLPYVILFDMSMYNKNIRQVRQPYAGANFIPPFRDYEFGYRFIQRKFKLLIEMTLTRRLHLQKLISMNFLF
jgi:hypothetical protein